MEEVVNSVALSSSEQVVIERNISIESELEIENVEEVFEIARCLKWIRDLNLKKVTLQFPDELLKFGPVVATQLQNHLQQRVAILGDTSYGDCCVDEVAAEHLESDGVIHFGNTCLTPTQRLPVLYVYTVLPLDISTLLTKIKCHQNESPERGEVFLFYDVRYHKYITDNEPRFVNIRLCKPVTPDLKNPKIKCGRMLETDIQEQDVIVYAGNSDRFKIMLALSFNKNLHLQFDSEGNLEKSYPKISKELMKRYYLIEKAKDVYRIGILVGTLGVSRYRDIIEQVKSAINKAGKKSYTFLVGKPNVAKLANFPEIDLYVVIACPENSVIMSKEFMQPVITPFELDVALNSNRNWTGEFIPDFQDILPGSQSSLPFKESGDESDVSLISGNIRTMGVKNSENEEGSNTALATQEMSLVHAQGGGEFLNQRSWQGLEQKMGETPVEKAAMGRKGIAFGYDGEGT